MTLRRLDPETLPAPAGPYTQAVEAPAGGRWLHVSGQIGMRADGSMPDDFSGQADVAWTNVVAALAAAGMDVHDLVKVTTFLTDASQLPALGPIRAAFLGEARPASTLLVVAALARPGWLVEVEAVAWRA